MNIEDLPRPQQPLGKAQLAGHYGSGMGMPSKIPADVMGVVCKFLSADEKRCLGEHGILLKYTKMTAKSSCGCTPGCSHPGDWTYGKLAVLRKYSKTSDGHDKKTVKKTMKWDFCPPILTSSGGYTTLDVEMTHKHTTITSNNRPLWVCRGTSYHFMSFFVNRGFDIVLAEGVQISSRSPTGASDLRLLHDELLIAKKEAGWSVPTCTSAVGGSEWPPALIFQSTFECVKCRKGVVENWGGSLTGLLASSRDSIEKGSLQELEEKGIFLSTPGTSLPLSNLNQDADIIAKAIEWDAVAFLQKVSATIDFQSRSRTNGCPIVFFTAILATLAAHPPSTETLVASLQLLPRGAFLLTPSCLSRSETFDTVHTAIRDFLGTVSREALAAVKESHHHVWAEGCEDEVCTWCEEVARV
eukprot:TRINITY_DN4538_c5_g1_i1.p1 TRINITY_DN4538_c5_g1~~TRINITY_DN4538_c5_g1_i1.p1  ORF type:complete len:428 (+),score=61.34 TRINITY_DN4538_c5_g1_i1:48-1286(+)